VHILGQVLQASVVTCI